MLHASVALMPRRHHCGRVRTSEAEGTSEGIQHVQEELIILSKKVPNCLL